MSALARRTLRGLASSSSSYPVRAVPGYGAAGACPSASSQKPTTSQRRHLASSSRTLKAKKKKDETRFNFNTSMTFLEEPDSDVGFELRESLMFSTSPTGE